MITTINPATGQEIQSYNYMSSDEVESIIATADAAQTEWNRKSIDERASLIRKLGEYLIERKEVLAQTISLEMGKPLSQSISEVEKCATVCWYYADNAKNHLQDVYIETEAQKSYITYDPLGIVFGIMPWNFPFWQVFRFAVPALMAGNGILLKHAENTTECALLIEQLMHESGISEDLFRTIIIDIPHVEEVIHNPGVHAVTFTGSSRVGAIIASQAGAVLKPSVVELGGNDPYIILDDADVEIAAQACAMSRLLNSGQSCIAGKRFIVDEKIHDLFMERLLEEIQVYKMGSPFDKDTRLGPIARGDLRAALHDQVVRSIDHGARCIAGGYIPDEDGFYYPITILADVAKSTPAYNEELFGPVFSIIKVENEEEAIRIANDTNYGLGAAIFSTNETRAEEIAAKELQAGSCFINDFVRSDPRLPFGGIKDSGYGRELSMYGIKEFVNVKTVYLK